MADKRSLLAALTTVILVFSAPAYAQSPTQDVYGGVGGQALSGAGVTGPVAVAQASPSLAARAPANGRTPIARPGVAVAAAHGELPFTGFQIVPLLLVAIGLIGFGLVLRRTSRRPS
jgi:hypothetical protein